MTNFEDLNVDSITNAKGEQIVFTIVFTYFNDYVETYIRPDKVWKTFEKSYQKDRPKEGYSVIDNIEIDRNDSTEPFSDRPVAIITKEALSAISENDKEKLEFGIRIVDIESKMARVIGEDIKEYFEIEKLSSGIAFDDVESVLNNVMEQTKKLNNMANQKNETQKTIDESETKEVVNDKEDNSDDYISYDNEIENDSEETNDDSNKVNEVEDDEENTDSSDEDIAGVEENPTPIDEKVLEHKQSRDEDIERITAQNKQHIIDFEKEPETPFDYANRDLLYEISNRITPIQVPSFNKIPEDVLRSVSDSEFYDKFLSLKNITEDKLAKRRDSAEVKLNSYRNEMIAEVHSKLLRRLRVENDELLRKSDFTTQYSPFHENYEKLKQSYQEIIDALPETKNSEIDKNKRKHEDNKRAYVERASQRAAEEYDEKNLHLINDNAQAYIENIKKEADKEFEEGHSQIEKEVNHWYVQNFNTLVPKIMHASYEDLNKAADKVAIKIKESVDTLIQQSEDDIAYLTKQFQDITYKEIETNKENESLINKRVHERTLEYTEFQHTIDKLEEEAKRLKEENEKTFRDNQQLNKDLLSERKQNEALEEALANRNHDLNQQSDNYRYLQKLIASKDIDKLQKLLDRNKVEPIKKTWGEKTKDFGSIIAAGILSVGIFLSAIVFGANNSEDVSKEDVSSEVQKAVQQKEQEYQEEQKQSDERIKNLEAELEKEKAKSKDKK